METDSGAQMEVQGRLFHFNKGAAFFSFQHEGRDQVCLFRPNKIIVQRQKLGASNFKSVEAISKVMSVGDTVGGLVVPHTDSKSYVIHDPSSVSSSITPCWYAQAVWKGERPPDLGCQGRQGHRAEQEEARETVIDNVPGRIVHNRLLSGPLKGGKGGANQTFIQFVNPEGKEDLAMFRNPRYFYVDGERARPDLMKLWPAGTELEVKFTAVHTPSLKEYLHTERGEEVEGDMAAETRFKPNWRARLVWMGERPEQDKVESDNADRNYLARTKRDKSEFLETIKDCEYMCARLEKIVSKAEGVLMLKSRAILFHIRNLSIDGQSFGDDGDLREHLEIGENLFAYVKTVPHRAVEEYSLCLEAAQIWKGKRSFSVSEETKLEKKKTPIPLPSEATHFNILGRVSEIESPGLGYLTIESESCPSLAGEKALFSRNRLYVGGQKLKFKDSISEHVTLGGSLVFDMVRADPEEAEGEYKWMAVLTWSGEKPDTEEIEEISKKIENYRAKILMFDDWQPRQGLTSGILQVMGGSSKIGERAFFSREAVYVFGARMTNADLAYVLKINDKVQLELEELPTVVQR